MEMRNVGIVEEEENLCPVCYSNPIVKDSEPLIPGDTGTVEFECKHRFCSDCTVEQLKNYVESAEIEKIKCFDYGCRRPISATKVKEIFTKMDLPHLFRKYERFKDKKSLDSDPLVRWCPKAGCDTHIRAEKKDTKKLQCPTCMTEVCFNCKDVWHGDSVTCEEAMHQQLEGWAKENRDNVSFCPMCKTKIEKNQGCNHMTCGFCKYEFCWACGESAASADGHFRLGNGCGVDMMDSAIKPGDHKSVTRMLKKAGTFLLAFCGLIIVYPFFLIFFLPFISSVKSYEIARMNEYGSILRVLSALGGLLVGFVFNICFIPLVLIGTVCAIVGFILKSIVFICSWLTRGTRIIDTEAARANRLRAEQQIMVLREGNSD